MPNPMVGQTLEASFTLTNPTAVTPDARRFKVAEAGFVVTAPNGAHEDFPTQSGVWVEVGGYAYRQTKAFKQAGVHAAAPYYKLLSGLVVTGATLSFTMASRSTTRRNNEDGSVDDVITYSDGRATEVVQVYGPAQPTIGSGAVAGSGAAPTGGAAAEIAQAYVDVLKRQPYAGEVEGYVASGKSVSQIRAEMYSWRSVQIDQYGYRAILGRAPSLTELMNYLDGPLPVEHIHEQMRAWVAAGNR